MSAEPEEYVEDLLRQGATMVVLIVVDVDGGATISLGNDARVVSTTRPVTRVVETLRGLFDVQIP